MKAFVSAQKAQLPINSVVSIAIVDDPYDGGKIEVTRSVRDDPLAGMYARSQIDSAELSAGRCWQKNYEASEAVPIRAIDPTKEPVDGGRVYDPFDPRRMASRTKAIMEIKTADEALGQEGGALIRDVLGRGMAIKGAAEKRGITARGEIEYLGKRFRECLDTLAILWGFAQR